MVGLLFRRAWSKDVRILVLYLGVTILFNAAMVFVALNKMTNLWLMHLYTPVQFGLLMWLFSHWQSPSLRRIFLLSIPAFGGIWLITMLLFESFNHFNSYTRPFEALILLLVSSFTLLSITRENFDSLFRLPSFWISSGTLIYFAGMIVLYAVSNVLLEHSVDTLRILWVPIQSTVALLTNLLFMGAFLCRPRT